MGTGGRTALVLAAVHVEPATRRRETVEGPGGRREPTQSADAGERRPGHDGGVEGVEVAKIPLGTACGRPAAGGKRQGKVWGGGVGDRARDGGRMAGREWDEEGRRAGP
jgi:hypothetical protein